MYLLRCADGTLYCGATNDLERRLERHTRRQVRYTRGRLPVEMVYAAAAPDPGGRSEAQRLEAQLKRLSRAEKMILVGG